MNELKICGIDPSIAACGKVIMTLDSTDFTIKAVKLYAYHEAINHSFSDDRLTVDCVGSKYKKLSILERQHLAYQILDRDMEDVKFVSFEGYAYSKVSGKGGASSRGMMQLGEFIGSLKFRYFTMGKGILVYPPTSVKRLATGNGGADKILMQRQFKHDYPDFYHEYIDNIIQWENPCSDISDAFWICEALRIHMKFDVLGSEALTAEELHGVTDHTPKADPISEIPILRMKKEK